jgi:peroxiredoxin
MRILFILFFSITAFLQSKQAFATGSIIHCKVNGPLGSGVYCYQLKNGSAESLGFKRPDATGECTFTIDINKEEVFFFKKAGGHDLMFKHVIYLKPGDNANIELFLGKISIDYDSCKIEKPNTETVFLQSWIDQFNQIMKFVSNVKMRSTFYKTYNDFVLQAEQMKQNSKTKNASFNHFFSDLVNTDLLYIKVSAFFFGTERMNGSYDSSASTQNFYGSLVSNKKLFCNKSLLSSSHGLDLITYTLTYKKFTQAKSKELLGKTSFAEYASLICNDTVKAYYVAKNMEQVRSYEDFVNKVTPFYKYFFSDELKAAYHKKEKELAVFAKGDKAYNFSLKDVNDKTYTLADFKGKVVVLDVWAMWCAPCLAEKPNFLALEEEFAKRTDIVFVGVSVDGLAKKDIWKNFVSRKGWKGIELLSDPDNSIMKYYKIEGIPRFMIFDKEGKIVTVDAARPSDPSLKKLIQSTLASSENR